MSIARDQFLGRIDAIRTILANPISTDTSPVPVPGSAAVVSRNGCIVMLFSALETFIRDRSLECAKSIDQTSVPYTYLPLGLKYASVVSTFEGLISQTRSLSVADKILEFEKATVAVASGYLGSPYEFTSYSFARDKSNVSADDIGTIARNFGVNGFWASARNVCTSAGMAMPGSIEEVFRQLARERHRAAHVTSHSIPHSQLTSSLPQATVIALAFDALISTAAHRLNASAIARGRPPNKVSDADIEFITVRPHRSGRWGAFRANHLRALLVEADQKVAMARASGIAKAKGLSVVCHDAAGRASTWTTLLG